MKQIKKFLQLRYCSNFDGNKKRIIKKDIINGARKRNKCKTMYEK